MVEIQFEEPPAVPGAVRRPRGEHAEIAAELRKAPGQWALVGLQPTAKSAGSVSYAIRTAKLLAYDPPGSFEAVARTVDGEHRLYVRFMGDAR
ncbi:hypothetical protein [Streptomyces halobius]|uniref:Uncharacterized protein n=1 Tax=Streptomyces halobius TaxID=2879846 RepID=A0ABY4M1K4_9ACTN|nr:hypothetical protein [Streptomyces halobius]UQA91617.1 hypothetical protein K9S39_06875 [Streptomyces halobius]